MNKLILSVIFILFAGIGCKRPVKMEGPAGYDFSQPQVLKMPATLSEISGIAFNGGRADTIYAEQDEEGRLYYFSPASLDIKRSKFGKKGDYEDIAICNGTAVVLRSDGVLFSFPLNAAGEEEMNNVQETSGLLPGGEYEGMYADEATNQLYVLCKACSAEKGNKSTMGYILQMQPGQPIVFKTGFEINSKDIAAKLNEKKVTFRPSAIAKHISNNQWYVLSSVNKLLVITDDQWTVKEVYQLDPEMFNQPEGIAFDKDENLYISNERGIASNANILKFTFAKHK